MTSKDILFAQNEQVPAVCLLLNGQIQVKMIKSVAGDSSTLDLIIGIIIDNIL